MRNIVKTLNIDDYFTYIKRISIFELISVNIVQGHYFK